MSAVVEASRLVQVLAGLGRPGESVKAAIRRAAMKAGLPAGLAKRLWYGEVRRVDAEVMDKLRAAAAGADQLKMAQDARATILRRLEACEMALGLHTQKRAGDLDLPGV